MSLLWMTALSILILVLATGKTGEDTAVRKLKPFLRMLPLVGAIFTAGCSDMVLLHPKGPIGETERYVILVAFALMLLVVIPVIIMVFWFPWKYRAANTKADYAPKWNFSAKIESVIWLIPLVIVTSLAVLVWSTTYHLDPYKPIASEAKPLRIEAVSLDWKWLFIYPDQNIAVVNQLVFPANVPLHFTITSDTVMTAFFIPQLGSQIYAMPGMQTQLHLLANEPGTFTGQNQQLSGEGYAYMHFQAMAVSPDEFNTWVDTSRTSPDKLDLQRYLKLAEPTNGYPVTTYSAVSPELFRYILGRHRTTETEKPDPMDNKTGTIPMTTAGQEEK